MEKDIDASVSSGTISSDLLSVILDACATDAANGGISSSRSLGLEDGNPVESSNLVLVIKRIIGLKPDVAA